jgi:hypothetical protein
VGFKTAWVSSPLEFGTAQDPETADSSFDITASDFFDLAKTLEA